MKFFTPYDHPLSKRGPPFLGVPEQLLFYEIFCSQASFCVKWPVYSFGHKWALILGTPMKFFTPYDHPLSKRGAHAKFGKDRPNRKHKKWRPRFQPQTVSEDRSDLIRSPIWGVPNNFYFMKLFDPRPPSARNSHFSVLGIEWAPLLGTPIILFTPL